MCDYRRKKKNIPNEHMNIKINDKKSKIFNKDIPNSMEALVHTGKNHSKNITKDNLYVYKPTVTDINKSAIEENFDRSINFRCYEFKEVVFLDNKFNEEIMENQMCKLCTMTAKYGNK